jgi:beta-lactamase family protein
MGQRGVTRVVSVFLVLAYLVAAPAAVSTDSIPAAGGNIAISPIMHASVQVEHAGKVIHVDPWSQGDYSNAKPAELILITDIHEDHLDLPAVQKIRKPSAPVVIPAASREKVPDGSVLANGETKRVAGVSVEAVAMYDLKFRACRLASLVWPDLGNQSRQGRNRLAGSARRHAR